jgi:glycosyltransferase involved in cell wall biosynthesis
MFPQQGPAAAPLAAPAPRAQRVLHLVPHDGVGGVEVAARSMAARDDLSCDFTLQFIGGPTLLADKRKVVEGTFRSSNNPLAHLTALAGILMRRPDVVVCSLWRTAPIGLLVKVLRPETKLVSFIHNADIAHGVDWAFSEVMMTFADAIWTDSQSTLSARTRPRHAALRRVISFVTERRFGAKDEVKVEVAQPAPRFVCWSRLTQQKGMDRALHFMVSMVKKRRDAFFEIWGPDSGEKANLERMSRELGLTDNVRFMGLAHPSEFPAIASRHSFYLQLSRREGMAMSVVEAMQLGLVPIVTAVGEMQRYCRAGQTGLICDPQRYDDAAEQVMDLLDDPGAYQRLREGARMYWENAPLYPEDVCQALREL